MTNLAAPAQLHKWLAYLPTIIYSAPINSGGNMGQPRNPKYDAAVEMYEKGLSIDEIAEYFEITRQAMWKILTRRGCKFRPHLRFDESNHFYRGGLKMEKRAQRAIERAIKKGILTPMTCEVCGLFPIASDGRRLVHAHHNDYSRPLNVRWLCQKHHHDHHKESPERETC
jgi:predicted DNA-binding protein YlxM (UPF0122 family)